MTSMLKHTLAGLALVMNMVAVTAAAAPVVSISGPATVTVGSTFTVQVDATNFADLYAYQFDVVFDQSLFTAISVGEGSFLGAAGSTFFDGGMIDNAMGRVSFIFNTLIGPGPGASGFGHLATLTFTERGIAAGGAFSLNNLILLNSDLGEVAASVTPLQVALVPEPAAIFLLSVGLVGMGILRRRSSSPPAVA